MPCIRIWAKQQDLDKISTTPQRLERIQEALEDLLMKTLAETLSQNGNVVTPDKIEVVWAITQRTRNSVNYAVDILFSERSETGDPGYITDPELRQQIRDEMLYAVTTFQKLPLNATVGVWVCPQLGGAYTSGQCQPDMAKERFVPKKYYVLQNRAGTKTFGLVTRTNSVVALAEGHITMRFVGYTQKPGEDLFLTFKVESGANIGEVIDIRPSNAHKFV